MVRIFIVIFPITYFLYFNGDLTIAWEGGGGRFMCMVSQGGIVRALIGSLAMREEVWMRII